MGGVAVYRNRHYGKRGAILANGPSLPQVSDLRRLAKDVITIGTNRSWQRWDSTYHVANDTTHYKENPELFRDLARQGRLFVYRAWPEGVGIELHKEGQNQHRFSFDLTRGAVRCMKVPTGDVVASVSYLALQLAVWMGLNPIYFLGLDLGGPHFYDRRAPHMHLHLQNHLFQVGAEELAGKVEVYVVGSPTSRCTAFPKRDLEVCLA